MIITDFHSHILPALDHGCKDTAESVRQLSMMRSAGTDIAVATSHFYPHIHKVDAFTRSVDTAVEKLMSAEIGLAPKLALGAEVLLCENLHTMDGLDKLCVRGTRVLLLELPFVKLKDSHYDVAEHLLSEGYTIMLAHIDRYLKQYKDGVDELLSMGALAQINASSLFSLSSRGMILKYISEGDRVCALGSDLHGTDEKCYRQFVRAQGKLKKDLEKIMNKSNKLIMSADLVRLN